MEEPGLQFVRGKPLKGWLRKQGGMMRSWQRKWFVLDDHYLFGFNREDDEKLAHSYLLYDYRPAELPGSPEDTDKFLFGLVPEKGTSEPVMLSASSDAERKEWMKGLMHNKYVECGGAIFGLPLAEAMKYEHKHGRTIPYIVEACVEHLKAFGMDAEGIFRLAGRAGLLKDLRAQFERGQHPSIENVDVHTVGSLLKAYLRELPESLVPPSLYQRAMNCAMRYSEANAEEKQAEEVATMAKLLQTEIPDDNYNTLAYLCDFLSRLAANSDKTKMDARNLALVFGPNLIRHMDNNPELLMLTADLNQHLAYMLIHHCQDILPPKRPPHVTLRSKELDIATDDLLRLSQPVDYTDPSLLLPKSINDLQGLDFNKNPDGVFTQSNQESPNSPFEFHGEHFQESSSHGQSDHGDGSTVSESGSRANTLERGLSKPVPPRRHKSSRIKQRRSNGAPVSPSVDPEDVQKALFSSGHPMMSPPPNMDDAKPPSGSDSPVRLRQQKPRERGRPLTFSPISPEIDGSRNYLVVSNRGSINGEVDSKGNVVLNETGKVDESQKEQTTDQACGDVASKLSPSRSNLEALVASLKAELVQQKTRSDQLIDTLKKKTNDMKEKYEKRITALEKRHLSQEVDLTGKLDMERNARAEAVQRTVELQNKLYKYKLRYGELQE